MRKIGERKCTMRNPIASKIEMSNKISRTITTYAVGYYCIDPDRLNEDQPKVSKTGVVYNAIYTVNIPCKVDIETATNYLYFLMSEQKLKGSFTGLYGIREESYKYEMTIDDFMTYGTYVADSAQSTWITDNE